jgi:HEAT repeat protein
MTDLAPAKEYLLSLSWNSISPIIHMLRDLKQFSARKMVCEVLTKKGKKHIGLLEEGIFDKRWYVVRNIVSVIGEIGAEEGVKFLKRVAKHSDLRVRKEIIASLFKIPGPQAGLFLVSFLEDEDERIRILASRGLALKKQKEALPKLEEILRGEQFRDKSPEEKKNILESFASIAKEEAIHPLVKMVNRRGWLKRDKHNETRIFAIRALSIIDMPAAEQAILQLSKKRNRAIREACRHALHRIDYRRLRKSRDIK